MRAPVRRRLFFTAASPRGELVTRGIGRAGMRNAAPLRAGSFRVPGRFSCFCPSPARGVFFSIQYWRYPALFAGELSGAAPGAGPFLPLCGSLTEVGVRKTLDGRRKKK